jgi:hypothetical protein
MFHGPVSASARNRISQPARSLIRADPATALTAYAAADPSIWPTVTMPASVRVSKICPRLLSATGRNPPPAPSSVTVYACPDAARSTARTSSPRLQTVRKKTLTVRHPRSSSTPHLPDDRLIVVQIARRAEGQGLLFPNAIRAAALGIPAAEHVIAHPPIEQRAPS